LVEPSRKKPEGLEKTTDPLQVTDKLYHIMLYTFPWSRFKLATSVVIGTNGIGSCKFNYHTIMATTAPIWKEKRLKIKTHHSNLKEVKHYFIFSLLSTTYGTNPMTFDQK
jgi:hypothetical protein